MGAWGGGVFTVGALSIAAFAIRLLGTTALAFLVIGYVKAVKGGVLDKGGK